MAIAYLMLGSNLGDKSTNLQLALKAVRKEAGIILYSSPIYESEPWGFSHPEYFYNQLLVIQTRLKPEDLLLKILEIEEGMGRIRNSKEYEARTIDIDILFYDRQNIQSGNLVIPHPKIPERRFVLLPLMKVASQMMHPITGQTIWQIYRECRDTLTIKVLEGK
jgi:2-amino-4-hydroxy-6-hydroxymethyldihydropteridine diphosphokinase